MIHPAHWRAEFDAWAKGRTWWARLPLLLFSAWLLIRWFGDPDRMTIFSGLDLGIHEAGHLLTRPFGTFVCALAGSAFQCLAPVVAGALLVRQGDFFALSFCLTWLAGNLFYVALYVADASAMALPLLSVGGGDVYHDWNTLLEMTGLLGCDGFLAGCLRLAGFACALAAVGSGAWMLRRMAVVNRT